MPDTRRQQYLQALGVECYRRRGLAGAGDALEMAALEVAEDLARGQGGQASSASEVLPTSPASLAADTPETGISSWSELQTRLQACIQCGRRLHRRKVMGLGKVQPQSTQPRPKALWLVTGIAPGVEASRQGQIFSGPSGLLYQAMFRALGIGSDQLYCTSLLKCPASNDAKPDAAEQATCLGFLKAQIAQLKPELVLCFGSIVGQALLDTDLPMAELRGQVHGYGEEQRPLVVTYHPDWLLRHPEHKPEAWQDLLLARARAHS